MDSPTIPGLRTFKCDSTAAGQACILHLSAEKQPTTPNPGRGQPYRLVHGAWPTPSCCDYLWMTTLRTGDWRRPNEERVAAPWRSQPNGFDRANHQIACNKPTCHHGYEPVACRSAIQAKRLLVRLSLRPSVNGCLDVWISYQTSSPTRHTRRALSLCISGISGPYRPPERQSRMARWAPERCQRQPHPSILCSIAGRSGSMQMRLRCSGNAAVVNLQTYIPMDAMFPAKQNRTICFSGATPS